MTGDIEAITLISSSCKHGPGSPGWVQRSWPTSDTFFDDVTSLLVSLFLGEKRQFVKVAL